MARYQRGWAAVVVLALSISALAAPNPNFNNRNVPSSGGCGCNRAYGICWPKGFFGKPKPSCGGGKKITTASKTFTPDCTSSSTSKPSSNYKPSLTPSSAPTYSPPPPLTPTITPIPTPNPNFSNCATKTITTTPATCSSFNIGNCAVPDCILESTIHLNCDCPTVGLVITETETASCRTNCAGIGCGIAYTTVATPCPLSPTASPLSRKRVSGRSGNGTEAGIEWGLNGSWSLGAKWKWFNDRLR